MVPEESPIEIGAFFIFVYDRSMGVKNSSGDFADPAAEIKILQIEKEALIKKPNFFEHGGAYQHKTPRKYRHLHQLLIPTELKFEKLVSSIRQLFEGSPSQKPSPDQIGRCGYQFAEMLCRAVGVDDFW